ncbi:hypothetical protein [Streptomyces sp. NPDC055056]
MSTAADSELALSSAGIWLVTVAGLFVVAILLVAFVLGSRRSAGHRKPTQEPSATQAAQARREMEDPPRHGDGWSTPDDDPGQGHPHR